MGYILPIQNYQAQHYQDRVNQPELDPMPIDRIYLKTIESSFYSLVNQEMQSHDQMESDPDQKEHREKHANDQKNDPPTSISDYEKPIYAELTGIGGQINRYV